MSYGMRVSLPGYDVTTATPEQCSIDSNYLSPKVDLQATPLHYQTVSIVFNNNPASTVTTTLFSLTHDYGYAPMALATAEYAAFAVQGTLPLALALTFNLYIETTPTHLYIKLYYDTLFGSLIGTTLNCTFYLYAENGA